MQLLRTIRRWSLTRTMTVAWIAVITLVAATGYGLTDPFWMIREGRAVLAGGAWVHPDNWGWGGTAPQFVPTSPLWQVLLAMAWSSGGRFGLLAFAAVSIGLGLLAVRWVARIAGAHPLAIVVSLIALLAFPAVLVYRPYFAAVALLLAQWALLAQLLQRPRARPTLLALALCAGSSALGIWLHASWTAYALASALGSAWLLRIRGWRGTIQALALLAASLAGTLVGPSGLDAWRSAARVRAICSGLITEWSPPWANPRPLFWSLLAVATLIVAGTLLALAWRERRTAHPLELLCGTLSVGLAAAGFSAIRFLPLAAAAMAPLLATTLTRLGRSKRWAARRARWGERGSTRYWTVILTVVALVLAPFGVRLTATPYPVLTSLALQSLPQDCRIFSDTGSANVLLLVRPDVRTWLDSREDMWGRARITRATEVLGGSLASLPEGTQCIVLPSGEYTALQQALASSPRFGSGPSDVWFSTWIARA